MGDNKVLAFVGYFAIFVNSALVAFQTNVVQWLPDRFSKDRPLFFFVITNFVILVKVLLHRMVPDTHWYPLFILIPPCCHPPPTPSAFVGRYFMRSSWKMQLWLKGVWFKMPRMAAA